MLQTVTTKQILWQRYRLCAHVMIMLGIMVGIESLNLTIDVLRAD